MFTLENATEIEENNYLGHMLNQQFSLRDDHIRTAGQAYPGSSVSLNAEPARKARILSLNDGEPHTIHGQCDRWR